jgi:hypothetical protein
MKDSIGPNPKDNPMKKLVFSLSFLLPIGFLLIVLPAFADKLVLVGDQTITGTVLQTNEDHVLLLTDYGTESIIRSIIRKTSIDRINRAEMSGTNRLPDSKGLILFLSEQPWASNLKQIPATVVDKGIVRNVPYISFRCGEDYEVNIYGDLDHPAAIEAGVYRKLLEDGSAKSNCVAFVSALLGRGPDKAIVQSLDAEKDLKTFDGLTFEITPPTADDAYLGWWITVYSEQKLNLARASDAELRQITSVRTGTGQDQGPTAWSADELKLARSTSRYPGTITFRDSSGQMVTNVQVVRVIDGVSLIWRDGLSGGQVKLADLPEELRVQFGYDPAKAAAAAEAADQRKQAQATANAAQLAQSNAAQGAQTQAAQSGGNGSYAAGPSGGGRVYVRGYVRSNGTYVQPYTRNYPHRH